MRLPICSAQGLASSGTSAVAYTGVGQAAMKIYKEEGVLAYWKVLRHAARSGLVRVCRGSLCVDTRLGSPP